MTDTTMPAAPAFPGDVPIALAGLGVLTLRPTLGAAKAVNAKFGGFAPAYRAVLAYDLDAFVAIVAAGLGRTEGAEIEAIERAVYETGIVSLGQPIGDYVGVLSRGGRPAEVETAARGKPD